MQDPEQPDQPVDGVGGWLNAARTFIADREDLVARLEAAAVRAHRTATVVAVVGEFKQGKSALVNSLLADSICPVDDHVATAAVTVVSHAPTPSVTVRTRNLDGQVVVEQVDPATRSQVITDVEDRRLVERVDIGLPNPLLADGLVLVDTPGVGGLKRAHAEATRAFLRHADALVFVSDATSELTETEVEFLREAVAECPTVVLALAKVDLFPHWRRIAELDRGHLERAGITAEIFPVSFPLRVEAVRRGDPALDAESGLPRLATFLTEELVPSVRSEAARRAANDIVGLVNAAAEVDRVELAALTEPTAVAEARLGELRMAKERLAALVSGGAKWRTVLNDEVTDLTHEVTHNFRDQIRTALDEMDASVDAADGSEALDAAGDALRTQIVAAVQHSFDAVDAGVEAVTATVAGSLGVDQIHLGTSAEITHAAREAAGGAWVDHQGAEDGSGGAGAFTFLRGAQGGVIMLAVVGGLLPAAMATVVVATPFLVGAGVLFGGRQLVDVRKQKRLRARQRVKMGLRKSVDDVQFRVGAELTDALRGASRFLRDELGERIEELHRSTVEQVGRLEHAGASDEATRQERQAFLTARLAQAEALTAAVDRMPAAGLAAGLDERPAGNTS